MPMYDAAHPGEILREWMGDDITVTALAKHLGISRPTLSNILNGSAGVTAEMAIKLAGAFPDTVAQFWVNLQSNYELSKALRETRTAVMPLRPVPAANLAVRSKAAPAKARPARAGKRIAATA